MLRHTQRGDTIIEVLFATTVFSLVAVAGLSIMNQGSAIAQRSLEIGLVRAQIDTQADALRYLNNAYVADYGKRGEATTRWNDVITKNAVTKAQDFSKMTDGNKCVLPTSRDDPSFALDTKKLNTNPKLVPTTDTATYAQIRYDQDPLQPAKAEGIWIQAVRSANQGDKPGFYDFHIRACWQSPGQATPVTLGTIVRLYEPRG